MFASAPSIGSDDDQRIASAKATAGEACQAGSSAARQQTLDDSPPSKAAAQQVEDAEEDVDQQKVLKVRQQKLAAEGLADRQPRPEQREGNRGEQGEQEVHTRPREGHQHHLGARAAKPARYHGDGLGPAEDRRAHDGEHHWQSDGADWVDMLHRVGAEPAKFLGRGIPNAFATQPWEIS
jgi:hypothetical protein